MEVVEPGQTCRWRLKEVEEDACARRTHAGTSDDPVTLKSAQIGLTCPAQLQPIKSVEIRRNRSPAPKGKPLGTLETLT
jgi:hypothetical protein